MNYLNVEIRIGGPVDEHHLDILSGALFELGALGIETRDVAAPITLVASFPVEAEPELEDSVRAILADLRLPQGELRLERLEETDWSTKWRQDFKPMAFGRLYVVPTWLEPPPEAELVLRLDPGMAFGTGTHETTALCLERIVERARARRVLDVGTGSGILALGALRAGAASAVGTDNDPEALVVARENAELNGLEGELVLSDRDPDRLGGFELVVANILRDPLIELAPKIAAAVLPGGYLLLSGLLVHQLDDVARAYLSLGCFTERRDSHRGEWGLIELRRVPA